MATDAQPQGVQQQHMQFQWSDGTGESDFNNLLGRRVRLRGLCARPELNGRVGTVMVWDNHAQRAGIDIPGLERYMAVRPVNLEEVPKDTKDVGKDSR
tara:strand:+ start:158 stop:451 length:294 start_codon:yes stop_codon:yes gene_type:complete